MMNHATATATEGDALLARVLGHLGQGGQVMIKSYTRPRVFGAKHTTMFRSRDRGVQIGWPGRSSVYVIAEMLAFSVLPQAVN